MDSEAQIDWTCQICLDTIKDAFMTRCGHSFCHLCIMSHLAIKKECPVCRSSCDEVFPNFTLNKLMASSGQPNVNGLSLDAIDAMVVSLLQRKNRIHKEDRLLELQLLDSFLSNTMEEKRIAIERLSKQLDCLNEDSKLVQDSLARFEANALNRLAVPQLNAASKLPTALAQVPETPFVFTKPSDEQSRGTKRSYSESPIKPDTQIATIDTSIRIPKLKSHMDDLQAYYFDWRLARNQAKQNALLQNAELPADLSDFCSSLSKFSRYSRFRTLATLNYTDNLLTNASSIVSSIDFDKDDEFFATAGVTKKIKIFEYAMTVADSRSLFTSSGFITRSRTSRALKRLRGDTNPSDFDVSQSVVGESSFDESVNDQVADERSDETEFQDNHAGAHDAVVRYPIRMMQCPAKISCLSYNSYIKPYLLSSDYEGVVTLWDASTGIAIRHMDEHEKRAWSVDFSDVDPMRMASGGDDTRVKLWMTNQPTSVATIESKANICSVKFHPTFGHHLAFGSADHHLHYYDLRNTSAPLYVFKGHRKAVSYVKFLNANEVVTASTDCTLRLWSLKESLKASNDTEDPSNVVASTTQGEGPLAGCSTTKRRPVASSSHCERTLVGHTNEKNFVGLSVNCDGEFIACGSETNEVFTYFPKLSKPIVTHPFGPSIDSVSGEALRKADPSLFVSSVCWKRKSPNILVAANSQGRVKVLEMI